MKPYQKYSDKALIPIMKDIIEALESNDMYMEDMSDVEGSYDELSYIITKELNGYLSDVDFEDVSYFIALIIMNDDFEPPLERPELRRYQITHIYQKVETNNYTYQTEMNSFIPIDGSILSDLQTEGIYEPWDGELIGEDNVDTEYSDDWVDDIEEI